MICEPRSGGSPRGQKLQKVIVIGCPGSGKSTFSRKLRDKTGLPLYYLDMLYHRADRTTVPREVFDARLDEILASDAYIIDGNYGRTLERRIAAADTVFLFDLPTDVCLDGIRSRAGALREDMPWVEDPDCPDAEFLSWVTTFAETQLPRIYALLAQYQAQLSLTVFHSHDAADAYIDAL